MSIKPNFLKDKVGLSSVCVADIFVGFLATAIIDTSYGNTDFSAHSQFALKPYFRKTFRTQTTFQKEALGPEPYFRKTSRAQTIFKKEFSPTNHI